MGTSSSDSSSASWCNRRWRVGLLQVLGLMVDSYKWPHGVMRVAFVVVVIGFLITIVPAWYHGERGEQQSTRNELLLLGCC